jgi:hypothetical protein
LNLQEIIKKIDNIKASIDNAFETGKLDFDEISSDLGAIGDTLAETLKRQAKPETGQNSKIVKSLPPANRKLKIEDFI